MNRITSAFFSTALAALSFINGCAGGSNDRQPGKNLVTETNVTEQQQVVIGKETELLLEYLANNGDYVNSREFPSLINATLLNELSGTNILVVDIRSAEEYSAGHIRNAVNREFRDIPAWFETGIEPSGYDRVIIVSSDGQEASYTTSLLRLMGYGNVYALKWGMSGWNQVYAVKGWYTGCSSDYQDNLEKSINEADPTGALPRLNTGMATVELIVKERFRDLFDAGTDDIMVDASEVFSDPAGYYIINYDRRDKYESGHIPGAIRYKPGGTLGIVSAMSTIPDNKPVVVYCNTGHNAGFVTAYLRLFGYDAYSLAYGNNGFMYDRMVEERNTLSWIPFSSSEVNNFEIVK